MKESTHPRRTGLLTALCMAAVLLAGCGSRANAAAIDTAAPQPAAETDTLRPLRDDIAQMIIIGFRGQTADSAVTRMVRDLKVGGVILFDYDAPTGKRHRNIGNPEQVRGLCAALQALSPETLLIGIDQEGGNVSRLRTDYGFGPNRSAKASAQGGADTVRRYAALCAEQLAALGINLNFAPCADVDVNPACPVIGAMGRSFGADAHEVAECCRIWVEEQGCRGVLSCLKHFPGHGSAGGDTHKGLVDVSHTWQRSELEPYRQLAAEAPMVMMAHVVNRRIDPSGLPASLSAKAYACLRDTLGYSGLVITDDMGMGAITSHYGYADAIALAINAGADLLCLGNNSSTYNPDMARQTIDIVEQLVRQGRIDEQTVRRAAARVRQTKQQLKH
ncbi:MAG: hypothetical protein K5650_04945 [Bacteroidales bacterium]|nr:hypothetical protein [Bacteroidales bacterium]